LNRRVRKALGPYPYDNDQRLSHTNHDIPALLTHIILKSRYARNLLWHKRAPINRWSIGDYTEPPRRTQKFLIPGTVIVLLIPSAQPSHRNAADEGLNNSPFFPPMWRTLPSHNPKRFPTAPLEAVLARDGFFYAQKKAHA
jgi:hypothetical protein